MSTQWKMVPVEPTREMLVAALKTNGVCPIYAAMLDAAPVLATGGKLEPVAWEDPLHDEVYPASFMEEIDSDPAARGCRPLYGPEVVDRLQAENAVLQLRLNAADQRIDIWLPRPSHSQRWPTCTPTKTTTHMSHRAILACTLTCA